MTPTHLGAGQAVAGVPTATRRPHHQHQQELPQCGHGGAGASGCPGPRLTLPTGLSRLHGPRRRRRRLLLPAPIPDTRAWRGVSNRPGVGPPAPAPTAEGSVLRPALLGRDWGPAGTGCPQGTGAGPGWPQQRRRDTVWALCRYRPCPAAVPSVRAQEHRAAPEPPGHQQTPPLHQRDNRAR